MIRFAIVDDEKVIISKINRVLNNALIYSNMEYQVFTYTDANIFLESNEFSSIDVVLLDIEIDNVNGIELATIIRKNNSKMIVIYVTSYMKYIKESFGLNVFDYINKTELENELPKTLQKLIEELSENYFLSFISERTKIMINSKEIRVIKYVNRKITVETNDNKYDVSSTTLKKAFKQLNKNFAQLSSDTIINFDYVKLIKDKKVYLKDSTEIHMISSRKYKEVKDKYSDYLIEKGRKWL